MASNEVLESKLDMLAEMQKDQQHETKELTKAVTTLVTQTKHFESMRIEDHKRMDKIEVSHEGLERVVSAHSSQISELKPVNDLTKYAIMVVISSCIGALGAIAGGLI